MERTYKERYQRKRIRRMKRLFFLAIGILITLSAGIIVTHQNENNLEIDLGTMDAANVCVMDLSDDQILYAKNMEGSLAPASTTKLLTALTVVEYCSGEELVTVGAELDLVAEDASRAGLRIGNQLSVDQLLEALLLPSGNDAAYVLAAYTGSVIAEEQDLDVEEAVNYFVEAMNARAEEVGAVNSNFVRPDGYDAEGQYSTAEDMGLIAKAFWQSEAQNGILRQIAGKSSAREVFADGTDVTWQNTNELLNEESPYYYENALGLKTGSSSAAGKCLISVARINGADYLAVVMGDSEEGRFEDSIEIYDSIEARCR